METLKMKMRIPFFLMGTVGLMVFFSPSCKKDSNNVAPTNTIVDIDGNVYHTVAIGTQVWMVENLKTTKYRNSDIIPNVSDNTKWSNLATGAQCNYNNDAVLCEKYGKLYNWYAVHDNRNIPPVGWHVATNDDWIILENYVAANLGISSSVSKSLASNTDWASSTYEGSIGNDLTKNNSTGFSALPGGVRDNAGAYHDFGDYGYWWSSTSTNSFYAWGRYLHCNYSTINRFDLGEKPSGFSVRCVKN